MTAAMLLGYGLATYAAIGLGVGLAFVAKGGDRALAQPASFTLPARLLLLPGAAALWPYVLVCWLKPRASR